MILCCHFHAQSYLQWSPAATTHSAFKLFFVLSWAYQGHLLHLSDHFLILWLVINLVESRFLHQLLGYLSLSSTRLSALPTYHLINAEPPMAFPTPSDVNQLTSCYLDALHQQNLAYPDSLDSLDSAGQRSIEPQRLQKGAMLYSAVQLLRSMWQHCDTAFTSPIITL